MVAYPAILWLFREEIDDGLRLLEHNDLSSGLDVTTPGPMK